MHTNSGEITTHLALSAGRLATHDHACAVHRSQTELAAAATAFAQASLSDDLRLLYIAADRPLDAVLEDLERSGLDPEPRLASGQLEVVDAYEAYLSGGRFDVDGMVARLSGEVDAARAAGWRGFRVAGEMGWALDPRIDPGTLVDYERRVDEVFRCCEATALCLYDGSRFDAGVLSRLAEVHPLRLCEPDDAEAPPWATARIERTRDGALALCGEIDLTNVSSLEASLQREAAGAGHLRIDLRGLSFIDVRGMMLLHDVAFQRARAGGRVTLIGASPTVRTVLDLLSDDLAWLGWERT